MSGTARPVMGESFLSLGIIHKYFVHTHAQKYRLSTTVNCLHCICTLYLHIVSPVFCTSLYQSTGWALQYTAHTVLCTPYLNHGSGKSSSVILILRADWVDKSDSLVHLCGSCIHWELLSVAVVGEKSFSYRLSSRVVAQWILLMKQPAEVSFSHPYMYTV